jgi:hypothetical protein
MSLLIDGNNWGCKMEMIRRNSGNKDPGQMVLCCQIMQMLQGTNICDTEQCMFVTYRCAALWSNFSVSGNDILFLLLSLFQG